MKSEESGMFREAGDRSCGAFEALISSACDGECTPEQRKILRDHLSGCEDCRNLMKEYRALGDLMVVRAAAQSCPPPVVARGRPAVFANRGLLLRLGGIAACVAFFILGQFWGARNANERFSDYISPIAVATPTLWAAKGQDSEQPFTEGIWKYRSAITEELRAGEIDWMKVRELVEAMGELRTDLELLTIHMAFLDIRTGRSPYEVADHWERLMGDPGRVVYKP